MTPGSSAPGATYRCYPAAELDEVVPFYAFVGTRNGPTDGGPSGCPWSFGEDHEAYFGWRADELIPRVALAAPRFLPHVALIHLGTNDDVPAADAEIRLLALR